ncbi:MAG: UDP-glucose 4-epimerase [Ktedonobacterales bacterium]|jgi:UDP-glucose 4-epimerase|nr:MAG: UDP-glucose 4-epimerase [Ktedonobacterales bacterium]
MRCLVTGVAGFVGSHLAERLIADGHDVLGVDCFLDYYPRALKEANIAALRRSPRFQFIEADLNANPLDELLYDMEWVFHQAAQAGVRASWGTSFDIYTASNISATQRLLEAALTAPKLARIVYASSSSVYGNADVLPVTEQTLTRPVSPYGVSKLAGEHLCALYWQSYRVPTVALRYFTVYGPRQRPDMAFHRFGKAILTGEPITVYGDAAQTRDFTYISDVVEANIRAAQTPDVEGMVFNIAGGSRVVLREVIETLATLAGREAQIDYQETARGDVRDTSADIALAQRLLGYAPQVALRDGLEQELRYLEALYLAPVPTPAT